GHARVGLLPCAHHRARRAARGQRRVHAGAVRARPHDRREGRRTHALAALMLLITCPWCGPRSQSECTYGGDATLARPSPDAPMAAWSAYVYERDNPKGPHDELWLHSAGC